MTVRPARSLTPPGDDRGLALGIWSGGLKLEARKRGPLPRLAQDPH